MPAQHRKIRKGLAHQQPACFRAVSQEAAALNQPRRFDPCHLQDRGQEVSVACGCVDESLLAVARVFYEQGHVHLILIDRYSVPEEVAISERLAMIGGYNEQRIVEQTKLFQAPRELTQLVVHVGDATVVLGDKMFALAFRQVPLPIRESPPYFPILCLVYRTILAGKHRIEWRRREVRNMRIHVVQEQKKWTVGSPCPLQKAEGLPVDLLSPQKHRFKFVSVEKEAKRFPHPGAQTVRFSGREHPNGGRRIE